MDIVVFLSGILIGILLVLLLVLLRVGIRSRRAGLLPPPTGPGRGRTAGDRSPLIPNRPAGAAAAELPLPREASSIEVRARVMRRATERVGRRGRTPDRLTSSDYAGD